MPSRTPGPASREWIETWGHADAELGSAIVNELAGHPELTEPAIARDVAAAAPDGATLVVSSSMPIRNLEWYGAPRDGLRVIANRGANGIDGVISTAVGVALAADAPTVVLVGDLAFLHDANALIGLNDRPVDLTVVVVDNDGGGIFEHLPQAASLDRVTFERLFATPHGVDTSVLATAYGIPVTRLDRQRDVRPAVVDACEQGGCRVLRLRTDRRASVRVHRSLERAMAAALDGLGSSG